MHSHLGLQEQLMLAAPLIVKEAGEPWLTSRNMW